MAKVKLTPDSPTATTATGANAFTQKLTALGYTPRMIGDFTEAAITYLTNPFHCICLTQPQAESLLASPTGSVIAEIASAYSYSPTECEDRYSNNGTVSDVVQEGFPETYDDPKWTPVQVAIDALKAGTHATAHAQAPVEDAAVTIEPKKSRVIVLAPPPDDPDGYRVWLQTEAIPKLHHLPVDQFAERLARIVHEHEEKMGARIAYHAGRIKGRLLQGFAHGHEKDIDAISRMAGVTTADKHAGIQTLPTIPDL